MSLKQQLTEAFKKTKKNKIPTVVPTQSELCRHSLREYYDCWQQKLLDEVNKKGSFPGANIPFSKLGHCCLTERYQVDLFLRNPADLAMVICGVHKAFLNEIISEGLVVKLSYSRQTCTFEINVVLPQI